MHVGLDTDISYVLDLQRRWSNNVGFLPRQTHERYLSRRQTLVVLQDGQHAGYLCWTCRPDGLVRVIQVAVDPELLRTTIGTKIMRHLHRAAVRGACSVIRLRCRSDLPANQFWPALGMRATATIVRPTVRGLPLLEWTAQVTDTTSVAHALATKSRPFTRLKGYPVPHLDPDSLIG